MFPCYFIDKLNTFLYFYRYWWKFWGHWSFSKVSKIVLSQQIASRDFPGTRGKFNQFVSVLRQRRFLKQPKISSVSTNVAEINKKRNNSFLCDLQIGRGKLCDWLKITCLTAAKLGSNWLANWKTCLWSWRCVFSHVIGSYISEMLSTSYKWLKPHFSHIACV